jgi:hypothetical protein
MKNLQVCHTLQDEEYEIAAEDQRIIVKSVRKWLLENGNRKQKI